MDLTPLNDYEARRIEAGDLLDAIHSYKHRTGATMAQARRVVYAKWREVKGFPEPAVKFFGYYDDDELPIKPGMMVTIRKGTIIHTTAQQGPKIASRTYKVKVNHLLNGVTRHRDHRDDVVDFQNPRVRWVGTGGYWYDADINDVPEAVS